MTDPSRAEYPPTVPMRIAAPTETINLFVDDSLQQELEDRRHDSHRLRTLTGLGMLAAAGGITAAVAWGSSSDEKVTYDVPYSTTAQETVEAVDTALAAAGSVLLPASVATIAAAKIAGRYSPAIRSADKASSMELTDDGKKKVGASRQALRTVAAGGVPVIASGAVMMSSLMSGIGQEITTGPSRPIENMFDGFPTDGPRSIVVQEDASEPMLQSHITRQLAGNIQQVAAERGVLASPVDLYLTSATYNGDTL